jgi:hypothetical protein
MITRLLMAVIVLMSEVVSWDPVLNDAAFSSRRQDAG